MSRIPFPLHSEPAPFKFMGEPRCVNVYPEAISTDGKSPVAWLSIPGQIAWATPTDVPSRGSLFLNDLSILYSLHLSTLYKITLDPVTGLGVPVAIAGVIPGSAPAVLVRNAATPPQVTIISDATTWCLNTTTNALTLIAHPFTEHANGACLISGRIVYSYPSGLFSWSPINNSAVVENALAYATAERVPDGLVGCFEDHGELWLPGPRSVEVWTTQDNIDLPFRPMGGSYINKGCASRDSMISFDNAMHWLGVDGSYYRANGYSSATKLTEGHAIERAITGVGSDLTVVKAFAQYVKGHAFLFLTCDSFTYAFDAATQQWGERKSYQRPDWRAWPYAFAFGLHIVGDKASGALNQLSDTVYDEVGQPIRRELTLPDIDFGFRKGIFDELALDLNTGAGLGGVASTVAGFNPVVMLDWSDDGGSTFHAERWENAGVEGDRGPGVYFRKLGGCDRRGRRFRIAMTDPVPIGFLLADIRARPGAR